MLLGILGLSLQGFGDFARILKANSNQDQKPLKQTGHHLSTMTVNANLLDMPQIRFILKALHKQSGVEPRPGYVPADVIHHVVFRSEFPSFFVVLQTVQSQVLPEL